MGFNKKYVPPYDIMVKEILTVDSKTFVQRYEKADALIGSSESIDLLNEYMKEYYEGTETTIQVFIESLGKRVNQ